MIARKWRPSFLCHYIIPEVCGNLDSLEIIFNRILPLRKFKGQEDVLIMLGRYIDGLKDGYKVLDALIALKQEYEDRFICIRGDREELFLKSFEGERNYQYWIETGGHTTLQGYLDRAELKTSATSFPYTRLKDIVPQTHIDFLKSLPCYAELENYVFFCSGIDWSKSIENNSDGNFLFDKTSSKKFKKMIRDNQDVEKEIIGDSVFVGSENERHKGRPFIHQKYMMMGIGGPKKLLVGDLNSMEFSAVKSGKSRIYKIRLS